MDIFVAICFGILICAAINLAIKAPLLMAFFVLIGAILGFLAFCAVFALFTFMSFPSFTWSQFFIVTGGIGSWEMPAFISWTVKGIFVITTFSVVMLSIRMLMTPEEEAAEEGRMREAAERGPSWRGYAGD